VPYTVTREKDSSLYKGQTKVVKAGKNGSKTVVREKTWVDGKLTSTKLLSQKGRRQAGRRRRQGRHQGAPRGVGTGTRHRHPQRHRTTFGGQHLRRRDQPRQRGDVGPHRPVRVRRQLAHQHRQRLLRRPAVRDRLVLATAETTSPSRADLASRAEQITIANRYYAKAGLGPWGCAHAA
jgi:hypothetical protein